MAIAGLVIGYVWTALILLLVLIWLVILVWAASHLDGIPPPTRTYRPNAMPTAVFTG